MEHGGYTYIMTNDATKPLYVGVTSNLANRVWEHKNKINPESFTAKYNLNKLVYFEIFNNIEEAISREKQLKRWHREWKLNLIKSINPTFVDLFDQIKEDYN